MDAAAVAATALCDANRLDASAGNSPPRDVLSRAASDATPIRAQDWPGGHASLAWLPFLAAPDDRPAYISLGGADSAGLSDRGVLPSTEVISSAVAKLPAECLTTAAAAAAAVGSFYVEPTGSFAPSPCDRAASFSSGYASRAGLCDRVARPPGEAAAAVLSAECLTPAAAVGSCVEPTGSFARPAVALQPGSALAPPKLCAEAYRRYGAPESVVRQVSDGWSLPLWSDPPLLRGDALALSGRPTRSAVLESDFVAAELAKLIGSGVVRRATPTEKELGLCVGDLVVARSKGELYGGAWGDEPAPGSAAAYRAAADGTLSKRRLCYDVSASLARHEDLRGAEYNVVEWSALVDAIRSRGPYTAREDWKAGFHHLGIAERDQRYLAFRSPVDGELYVWTRLPFGLRCSPWLFALAARPLLDALRQAGCAVFLQVDDLVFIGDSVAETFSAVKLARRVAGELGIRLSADKSVAPAIVNRVLGMLVRGDVGVVEMPQLRRERYARMLRDFRNCCCVRGWTTRAVLERVTGVCTHLATFVPLLRHLLEPLYAALDSARPVLDGAPCVYTDPHQRIDLPMALGVIRVIDAWISWMSKWGGRLSFASFDVPQLRRRAHRFTWVPPLFIDSLGAERARLSFIPGAPSALVLRTDASATGGGGHCTLAGGVAWTFRCRWWEDERDMASAVRELRAMLVGLRQLERQCLLHGVHTLVWISDAQAAVRAVRKGASRVPHMEAALRALALWEARAGVHVWPFWVPRERLTQADELSRYWASAQDHARARTVVTRDTAAGSLSRAWVEQAHTAMGWALHVEDIACADSVHLVAAHALASAQAPGGAT